MDARLVEFAELLRQNGLAVSVAEVLDVLLHNIGHAPNLTVCGPIRISPHAVIGHRPSGMTKRPPPCRSRVGAVQKS